MVNTKELRFLRKKELVKMIVTMDQELQRFRGTRNAVVETKSLTKLPELNANEKNVYLSGRKLQAIKDFKERTGIGLKEAKDIIDAWARNNPNVQTQERSKSTMVQPITPYPNNGFRLGPVEIGYIHQGFVLQAVKSLKDRTGLGLKECKQMCNAYRDRHPELKR